MRILTLLLILLLCFQSAEASIGEKLLYPINHPIASAKYVGEKLRHPIATSKELSIGAYHGMCAIGKWNEESHFGSFMALAAGAAQVYYGVTGR